ncbi:MAG TPA: endonuclease/exonuclease/phosphatase family protein [Pirellulales bacterium]
MDYTARPKPPDGGPSPNAPPKTTADAAVPVCEPGSIRIVSWNVFSGAPNRDPEPFARVFQALRPDVILLQEWINVDAVELEEWFAEFVPIESRWRIRQSAGRGVAIAARQPLQRVGPFRLELPKDLASQLPSIYFGPVVGFVAASLATPAGELVVASTHLTCCGGPNTIEEDRRIAEAEAINAALSDWRGERMVFGGDLNLIGTNRPLDALRAGLDRDRENLAIAQLRIHGHETEAYTWRDSASRYPPGQLDRMGYSARRLFATNSFILDASRLSGEALERSGLHDQDTCLSDHLPLVLDVSPMK